jgi:hypothetical protein
MYRRREAPSEQNSPEISANYCLLEEGMGEMRESLFAGKTMEKKSQLVEGRWGVEAQRRWKMHRVQGRGFLGNIGSRATCDRNLVTPPAAGGHTK